MSRKSGDSTFTKYDNPCRVKIPSFHRAAIQNDTIGARSSERTVSASDIALAPVNTNNEREGERVCLRKV